MQNQVTKLDRDVTKKRAYVRIWKSTSSDSSLNSSWLEQDGLARHPDVAQLLSVLGNRARDVGLSIDRFEPLGETTKDFYSEILF